MFQFLNFYRRNHQNLNRSEQKRVLRLEQLEDRRLLTVSNPAAVAADFAEAAETVDFDLETADTPDDITKGIFYMREFSDASISYALDRVYNAGFSWKQVTLKFDPNTTIGATKVFKLTETFTLNYSCVIDFEGRTIDGNGNRIFDLVAYDGIVIKNAKIINGKVTGENENGGVVQVKSERSITFTNCEIYDNSSESLGGFAYVAGGTLNMYGCTVYNNSAQSGGVVFGLSGSSRSYINLESSVFYLNHATEFGGVVEAQSCDLNIVNCTMAGNWAFDMGGAVLVYNYTGEDAAIYSNTKIYNSIIAYNESAGGSSNKDVGVYNSDDTNSFTERFRASNNIISQEGDYFVEAPELFDTLDWETYEILQVVCTNANDIDLHLVSDAVAIDDGASGKNTYAYDADGNARKYGGYIDIGAYEYQGACAGTFSTVVTTLSDRHIKGKTTLHEAILNANRHGNSGTITFDESLYGTIYLDYELALTNGSITIIGDERITLDGDGSRVLYVDGLFKDGGSNIELNLSGLTIQNGYANGRKYGSYGGGLWATNNVDVTIDNCVFKNNTVYGHGMGGVYGGGMAITMDSNLTMTNSTVTSNTAEIDYCCHDYTIYEEEDDEGNLIKTTVFDYQKCFALGGGIYIGNGAYYTTSSLVDKTCAGTADIRNCSITYNSALAADEECLASYGNIAMGGGIYAATSCLTEKGFKLYDSELYYNACVGGNVSANGENIGCTSEGEEILAGNAQGYKWTKGAGLYLVGLHVGDYVTAEVSYCKIQSNELREVGNHRDTLDYLGQGYAWGAGIYNEGAYLLLISDLVTDNVISGDITFGILKGAGIYNDYALCAYNCTIANNLIHHNDDKNSSWGTRQTYGAGICNDKDVNHNCDASLTLFGCILADNTYTLQEATDFEHPEERRYPVYIDECASNAYQNGASFTLEYSLYSVEGMRYVRGYNTFRYSVEMYPEYNLFVDAMDGDYTLCANSAALEIIPADAEYCSALREYDLRGEGYARVVGNLMDAGCYEYQTPTQRLEQPKYLYASAYKTSITVSWDAVENASEYRLYFSKDQKKWVQTSLTQTSYTFENLAYETLYYFKVQAVGKDYNDSYFSVTSVWTPAPTLDTPTDISVYVTGDHSILVYWKSIENAGAYTIGYSIDDNNWNWEYVTNTVSSYHFDGLASGTTYYFKVQATNGGIYRDSDFSRYVSAQTTGKTQLSAPTIDGWANGSESISVYWDSVNNAVGYTVYYSENGTDWTTTTETSPSSNIDGLTPGTNYYIKVKAVPSVYRTDLTESDFSNVIQVKTQGIAPGPLNVPTNVAYNSYGANRALITWDAVENAAEYLVECYSNDFDLRAIYVEENFARFDDLSYGTTYTYRVKALAPWGTQALDSDYSTAIQRICDPSDVNSDGKINLRDFNIFLKAYNTSVGDANYDSRADINGDGNINLSDFSYFSNNFGKAAGADGNLYPAALASAVETLDLDFVEETADDYGLDVDLDVF